MRATRGAVRCAWYSAGVWAAYALIATSLALVLVSAVMLVRWLR